MISRPHLQRAVLAAAMGLAVAGTGLATASTAQAYDTGATKISCSAAKVRASYSTASTVRGIAYKGDRMTYNQWVHVKKTGMWWTRGTVTRRSDGARISGYVIYDCANPYGTNPAPKPQ